MFSWVICENSTIEVHKNMYSRNSDAHENVLFPEKPWKKPWCFQPLETSAMYTYSQFVCFFLISISINSTIISAYWITNICINMSIWLYCYNNQQLVSAWISCLHVNGYLSVKYISRNTGYKRVPGKIIMFYDSMFFCH